MESGSVHSSGYRDHNAKSGRARSRLDDEPDIRDPYRGIRLLRTE